MRKHSILVSCFCLTILSFASLRAQPTVKSDTAQIQLLIEQAKNTEGSNLDSAMAFLDSAFSLAENEQQHRMQLKILNNKGSLHWKKGNLDSAGRVYHQNLKLSKELEDTVYLIKSYSNLGLVYHKTSISDSAEYFFTQAIELAELANRPVAKAITQNELGILYMSQNRSLEAIDLLLSASKILSESGDPFRLTQLHVSLGWMYQSVGDYKKSIKHYRLATVHNRKNEVIDFSPTIYNNMGMTFQAGGQLDSAKYYYKKALNLAMENPASSVVSQTINLGNIYYQEENYPEALRYYQLALKNPGIEKQKRPYSAILINMGLSRFELGDYDSAEYFLEKGLQIARDNTLLEFQQNAYHGLFELDSARNRMLSALKHYKKFEEIEDSLKQEQLTERIKQLEYEQNIQEKEQENETLAALNELNKQTIRNQHLFLTFVVVILLIAILFIILLYRSRKKHQTLNNLLEQKNREIEIKKQELEQINNTKDKLFAIVAHDLRNPFDALLGLLRELEQNYDDYDDEFRKEIISSLRESSNNAYKLLINLLEWSRTQRGYIVNTPEYFEPGEVINEIYNNILTQAQDKNIQLVKEFQNGIVIHADPQFVRSILINLLNNAVKFTPPGGKVMIKMEQLNGKAKICVEDTGIGIPPDKIDDLFTAGSTFQRHGTNNEAGTGLGLVMCKEYVRLMDEELWVTSEEGKGSVFCFTLPLKV